MRIRARITAAAAVGIALGTCAPAQAIPNCDDPQWVGAWASSPSDAAGPRFDGQTLRLIARPSLGGSRVRVRLSNRLGSGPVTFSSAVIARRASGPEIAPNSSRTLRFSGRTSVTLAAGQEIRSDATRFGVTAFEDLAVSLHVAAASGPPTRHLASYRTSYVTPSAGPDHTADRGGGAFSRQIETWPYLTGIDVLTNRRAGAVVALGDSITDGAGSPLDANRRYPDLLAQRLSLAGRPLSVLNAGIGGNRISADGADPRFGPSILNRLAPDVIDQAGVRDVIILAGTNDIGMLPAARAQEIIAGLRAVIDRLHAAGLRALVGTQTPSRTPAGNYGTLAAIAERNAVNDWVRRSGVPDGVIDFHAATRDPGDPDRLRPDYDLGDHLHPSDPGYGAMARAVPLDLLRGPSCVSPIALRVSPRSAVVGRLTRFRFRAAVRRGGRWRPLAGATVRVAGRTARTDRHGKATVVGRPSRTGRLRARASRAGHEADEVVVRVRRR